MKKVYLTTLLTFAVIIMLTAQNCDYNWNVARGGNSGRNGLSNAYGPKTASPSLYWSGGLSACAGTPSVIYEDNLIVTRRTLSNCSDEAWIANYNLYTGELYWQINLPQTSYDQFEYVLGVDNERVYATKSSLNRPSPIYALDLETGEIIWSTNIQLELSSNASASFNDNGDLILGGEDMIYCLDKTDGSTLWSLVVYNFMPESAAVAVHDNKGYFWTRDVNAKGFSIVIGVCDLETGEYLYSSPELRDVTAISLQNSPSVGSDGSIYAPFAQSESELDSLFCLTDQGDTLSKNWALRVARPSNFFPTACPDNTVLFLNSDYNLIKIDSETGNVLYTSEKVFASYTYLAVGADGYIYITNDWPEYSLSIYDPELNLVWTEQINGVRAPTLGNGALAVVGKQNEIRVYEGRFVPVADAGPDSTILKNTLLTLDGTGSFDMNPADELTYLWEAPAEIILDDYTLATPSFTAPDVTEDTEYEIYLTVSDGEFTSCTDTVVINVVAEITCIKGVENNIVSVFPNPAEDIIHIRSNNNIISISITDITGKIILQQNKRTNSVDISKLEKGIYFIIIYEKENQITEKIIIK